VNRSIAGRNSAPTNPKKVFIVNGREMEILGVALELLDGREVEIAVLPFRIADLGANLSRAGSEECGFSLGSFPRADFLHAAKK